MSRELNFGFDDGWHRNEAQTFAIPVFDDDDVTPLDVSGVALDWELLKHGRRLVRKTSGGGITVSGASSSVANVALDVADYTTEIVPGSYRYELWDRTNDKVLRFGTALLQAGSEEGDPPLVAPGDVTAFSLLREVLGLDIRDASLLCIGDSLQNDTAEWFYLFVASIAAEFPAFTVDYYLWNDAASAYATPTRIQAGTGAHILRAFNFAIAGTTTHYMQGSRFPQAVIATAADCVVWSHGKNHVVGAVIEMVQAEFETAMDQVRIALPNAGQVVILQPPNRDDDNMALAKTSWDAIGALRDDILLIDTYTPFIDAGKPSGWYTDNVHPNSTGTAVMLTEVQAAWDGTEGDLTFDPGRAWFKTLATNLLDNGALASVGTSAPASWISVGTVAYARETTIKYPGYADSLKLNGSGASQARIQQALSGAAVTAAKGQTIFFAALAYIPSGADATVGRLALVYNGTGGKTLVSRSISAIRDGFALIGIGPVAIPADAGTITAILYHDSDSTPDTDPVYFQRASLTIGSVPRDF